MSAAVLRDDVIKVEHLTRRYGGASAVNDVSFSVERGETFGLLGPNGAGKTTTILMLLGLTEITEGTARVLGLDPAREPLAVKRRVGYLPDAVGFYDHLSAIENLIYTARLIGIPREERELSIARALERVRLQNVSDKKTGTFSRGMKQRLGIAEMLMKRAEIVILDEPTSGLDPQSTAELITIIRSLKEDGVTTLLSSHQLDQVQSVCDRVALFNGGRIALMGTVPELARQVLGGEAVVEVEARGIELAGSLKAVPGVVDVETVAPDHFRLRTDRDIRPEAAAAVVAAGGRLTRLSLEQASLETIYNRYFQKIEKIEEHANAA